MQRIIIEIDDNCKIVVNYNCNGKLYPICEADKDNFNINEITNNSIITIVTGLITQLSLSLRYQCTINGRFAVKPLNKPADSK